jgi:hypothetical protein
MRTQKKPEQIAQAFLLVSIGKHFTAACLSSGREERIRTSDPSVPKTRVSASISLFFRARFFGLLVSAYQARRWLPDVER